MRALRGGPFVSYRFFFAFAALFLAGAGLARAALRGRAFFFADLDGAAALALGLDADLDAGLDAGLDVGLDAGLDAGFTAGCDGAATGADTTCFFPSESGRAGSGRTASARGCGGRAGAALGRRGP